MSEKLDIDNDIDKSLMNALYGVENNKFVLSTKVTIHAFKIITLLSKVIESSIYGHFVSINARSNDITDHTWSCIIETLNDLKIISEQLKAIEKQNDN